MSEASQAAETDGHLPGNLWEQALDRHVSENQPELKKAMRRKTYRAFLTSESRNAIDQMALMIQQGMNPRLAKEIAQRQMLETNENPNKNPNKNPNEIDPQGTGDTLTETSSVED